MFDFQIQLARTNDLLERIANALDRAAPPIPEEVLGFRKRGPESISTYGDHEKQWERENLYSLLHGQGLAPAQEQAILDETMKSFGKPLDEIDDEEGPWR